MASNTRHIRRKVLRRKRSSREQESSAVEEEESDHSSHGVMEMTSSEARDESYRVPSHMVDPDSSSQSDSGSSSNPQVDPRNKRKKAQHVLHHGISRPTKSKSSSEARDESYRVPSHMVDPDSSSQSDSGSSSNPQVCTLEPGLYIPLSDNFPKWFQGIGIRIADEVLITESGHEVLSSIPKELSEIEALLESYFDGLLP
ncbi:hypothetical protein L7F22_053094 [Adiantum nelumboides]|nr:hypothetical protein [Adiantum nelumboides]